MTVTAAGSVHRLIDACATARVRLTGLAYGDQGLFVERQRFERIGGFPPLRLMEDVFLSKTLRREGAWWCAAPHLRSPRRWQRQGIVPADAAQLDTDRVGCRRRPPRSADGVLSGGALTGCVASDGWRE